MFQLSTQDRLDSVFDDKSPIIYSRTDNTYKRFGVGT